MTARTLILAPGHSIEQHEDGTFRNAGLIQKVAWLGGGRFERTGVYDPALSSNDDEAYLAGGRAVTMAALIYARDALRRGDSVEVVMIGGKPGYLQKLEGPAEGAVMLREFRDLSDNQIPASAVVGNLTTEDDMQSVLERALIDEESHVAVIMMQFRIARAAALMQKKAVEDPRFIRTSDRIAFVPAEFLLLQPPPRFFDLVRSRAYRATWSSEMFGLRKLIAGEYERGGTT